jgi:uncharacterized protein YndB with AHSA1/START domain
MDLQSNDLVLTLECRLRASPSRVFTALTDPEELARWWGPHGFTTRVQELELTEGGPYRFRMQPPEGGAFHVSGEYLAVDPPRRLVFTFRWDEPDPHDRETVVRIALEAEADTTLVALWQGTFATEARLDLHRAGWTDSFERLRALLAPPRVARAPGEATS